MTPDDSDQFMLDLFHRLCDVLSSEHGITLAMVDDGSLLAIRMRTRGAVEYPTFRLVVRSRGESLRLSLTQKGFESFEGRSTNRVAPEHAMPEIMLLLAAERNRQIEFRRRGP